MEHAHSCLYCGARWLCEDDCLFAGPSACESCVMNLGPNATRRVIPLRDTWILNLLAERAAEQLREKLRRDRPL